MYQLQAEVEIEAPPERVWAVLTDFASYPQWSGWKGRISGEARKGAWLKVLATPRPGKIKMTLFRVLVADPERELRWNALYGPFWALSGQRYWVLEPLSGSASGQYDGKRTKLIFGEAYFGWMVPLLRGMLEKKGPQKYEELALRLKQFCEQAV